MFPINNKPSIQYVVEEAITAGIKQILFIVSRSKNLIVDYFDHSLELEMYLHRTKKSALLEKVKIPDIQFYYTRQPFARGLGDAVLLGKEFVREDPFAVLLPDDIIVGGGIKDLMNVYEKKKSHVIGLKEVEMERLQNYGVIEGRSIDKDLYSVVNIVEKPKQNAPSNLAVIGRYVFSPNVMSVLEKIGPDGGGEIQLTDGIKQMLNQDKCYGTIIGGKRFDIGLVTDYLALQNYVLDQN